MNATILPLPTVAAPAQQIGHFIRLGHSGHRMESLLEQGRLLASRIVVEASALKSQSDLVKALRAKGTEVVLDTNVDELSELGRFAGLVKSAPWAKIGEGSPLLPAHFDARHASDIFGMIARAAVSYDVSAVLAPAHFLKRGSRDDWFSIDLKGCENLREALDREGGQHIAIDYPLICTYNDLRDEAMRGTFVASLHNVPFENLWLRVSGFGSDTTPVGCSRYISATSSMHNLGRPIVADSLGGLVGLSALAFGSVSGLCHGIGEEERFNATSWSKPRTEKKGGGRTIRISVGGLNKSLTEDELRMVARAQGGLRLVACGNRNCCPHGLEDMVKNWRAHTLKQATDAVRDLEAIPDLRRTRHFLDSNVVSSSQVAHKIASLKIADEKLSTRLRKHSRAVDELRSMLNNLYEVRADSLPRMPAVSRRHVQKVASKLTRSEWN